MFAHLRWFVEEDQLLQIESISSYELLLLAVIFLSGLMALFYFDRHKMMKKLNSWADKKFKPYSLWVPTITRISLGLVLIILAWQGNLLATNIGVSTDTEQLVSWLLAGSGIILLTGLFTRSAAISIILLYVFSLFITSPMLVFEHIEYLGLGLYLAIVGGGNLSIEKLNKYDYVGLEIYQDLALNFIRIGTGASLIILAFTEKLFNFSAAMDFLGRYHWNMLSFLGLGDRWFIVIAGTIELLIGLSLILNKATRLSSLALLSMFTLTAIILGPQEVVGHLFALGVVAAVWVNYPKVKLKKG